MDQNQKERIEWASKEIQEVCKKAGVKIVIKQVPQINILCEGEGKLEDLINKYNNDHKEKKD